MADTVPDEIQLSPYYYLENFESLLSFVLKLYEEILSLEEIELIERFDKLSQDAKCIFVRLFNRKGELFRLEKVDYVEIDDLMGGFAELEANEFVRFLTTDDFIYYSELLDIFTKGELIDSLKTSDFDVRELKMLSKPELILYMLNSLDAEELFNNLIAKHKIIKLNFSRDFLFFRFLYFGNLYTGMSEFVIRDIGNAKFGEFDESSMVARFQDRKAAVDRFNALEIYEAFTAIKEIAEPMALYVLAKKIRTENLDSETIKIYDKIFNKTARILEKLKLFPEALEVYLLSQIDRERERMIRLCKKLDNPTLLFKLTEEINNAPRNFEELTFVKDLDLKRKSVTTKLKTADEIEIELDPTKRVETLALEHFQAEGFSGVHSENWIWNSSFGLVFWDIIFKEAIHNPLQRRPDDLYSQEFVSKRQRDFDKRLEEIQDKLMLEKLIIENYESKRDTLNPFVHWHPELPDSLNNFHSRIETNSLSLVFKEMLKNLIDNSKGFPDLFIYRDSEYQFIEVKSANDKLSAQQLFWQEFLNQAGIPTKILRVKYFKN